VPRPTQPHHYPKLWRGAAPIAPTTSDPSPVRDRPRPTTRQATRQPPHRNRVTPSRRNPGHATAPEPGRTPDPNVAAPHRNLTAPLHQDRPHHCVGTRPHDHPESESHHCHRSPAAGANPAARSNPAAGSNPAAPEPGRSTRPRPGPHHPDQDGSCQRPQRRQVWLRGLPWLAGLQVH
jgi:hypothetical protein